MNRSDFLRGASFAEGDIRPVRVGRGLWIGPVGVSAPTEPGLIPIWLGSGPAYGTGAHPTTQLCLRTVERHLKPGARVVDLGTGTGILAIAAARLGAESVYAVDVDPAALDVARANLLHNRVDGQVQFERGTLTDVLAATHGNGRYAWVIANILAHVLVEFFGQGLPDVVEPGGWLVLSGFLRTQTPQLRACLGAAELELLAEEEQDGWICMIARRTEAR